MTGFSRFDASHKRSSVECVIPVNAYLPLSSQFVFIIGSYMVVLFIAIFLGDEMRCQGR